MSRPARWWGVELRAPDQAPRHVSIRARTAEIAARLAEQRHPGHEAADTWRIEPRFKRHRFPHTRSEG